MSYKLANMVHAETEKEKKTLLWNVSVREIIFGERYKMKIGFRIFVDTHFKLIQF